MGLKLILCTYNVCLRVDQCVCLFMLPCDIFLLWFKYNSSLDFDIDLSGMFGRPQIIQSYPRWLTVAVCVAGPLPLIVPWIGASSHFILWLTKLIGKRHWIAFRSAPTVRPPRPALAPPLRRMTARTASPISQGSSNSWPIEPSSSCSFLSAGRWDMSRVSAPRLNRSCAPGAIQTRWAVFLTSFFKK